MTETTPSTTLPDLREGVFAAQSWVADLLDQVGPEQYGRPTPCAEFDVEALLRHLFGVANRLIVMGQGQPAEAAPSMTGALPDDVPAAYRALVAEARRHWSDDASLARMIDVPWGQVPGAGVLGVYLAENLTHGWDLAVATGQDPEADPQLAETAQAVMRNVLPVDGRADYPYGEPVEPAATAGATERLANWLGRARP